ncbi:MAG: mechanosensitive ion channel family protein [Bdellovibrionota bacterium]
MNFSITRPWIPLAQIESIIFLESYLVIAILALAGFFFYTFFLKGISDRRHQSLRRRFKNFSLTFVASASFSALHWFLIGMGFLDNGPNKLVSYLALFSVILGAAALIMLAQYFLYLYLFKRYVTVGVPRVIANSFTLVFACGVIMWLLSELFGIRLAPLLATSAVFSLVLGLALQDTLGNLFSGVALQLERPFGIGDWVEVQLAAQKWTGQIQEINWRATLLLGFSDELISIPNRTMAQSQVLIFTHSQKPPRRNQAFTFTFNTPIARAKELLLNVTRNHPLVLKDPEVRVYLIGTDGNGYTLKTFYSISDFGAQYRIGDQIMTQFLDQLTENGMSLALNQMQVVIEGKEGEA